MPSAGVTDASAEGIVVPDANRARDTRAPSAKRGPMPNFGSAGESAEEIAEPEGPETRSRPHNFVAASVDSCVCFVRWSGIR